MTDGALGGMMGLIPLTIGAGLVMKITDKMMPPDRGSGGSRNGRMQGEQERYEEKKPMRKGMGMGSGMGYGSSGSGMGSMYGSAMSNGGGSYGGKKKKSYGNMGTNSMTRAGAKGNVGKVRGKKTGRAPGGHKPSDLSYMMRMEGRKVMGSVGTESRKVNMKSLGSLPGVGNVSIKGISDIGIGGNKMFDVAKRSMKARTLGRL